MHRAAKWKVEKSKVQVVFRLQLSATQVPQPGWEKLFVSLISVETGKAIAKTTKVSVRSGSCKWSDPIYETTRLLQDTKTQKFDEKLYKLVVSTGSSRYGFLGEANIDLADYVEALKPSTVSLPLQSCNFGTILHVTIQPLTEKTGFREFEQQQELTERGVRKSENGDDESDGNALASEEKTDGPGVKEKPRSTSTARLHPHGLEVPSIQKKSKANGNHRGCIIDDAISNSSPSARQEQHEVPQIGGINNGTSQDAARYPPSHSQISKTPPKSNSSSGQVRSRPRQRERSSGESTHGWSSDYSTENDMASVYEENERLRANLQAAESSIMELKKEVASIEKQAKGQAAEIETLMQRLATEINQGQDFPRDNSDLKLEHDSMGPDLKQLEVLVQGNEEQMHAGNGWLDMGDTNHFLEDLKKELDSEKQVNRKLSLQLEKMQRAYSELLVKFQGHVIENKTEETELQNWLNTVLTREQNEELIVEATTVTKKDTESGIKKTPGMENEREDIYSKIFYLEEQNSQLVQRLSQLGAQQDGMEKENAQLATTEVSEEDGKGKSNSDSTLKLEERIRELSAEAEDYKMARDSLENKTQKLEYEYQAIIHELEERVFHLGHSEKQLQEQLENLRDEHATALYSISSLETQVEKLKQEHDQQTRRYAADKDEMALSKAKLEQRANRAETALKRTQWNNASTVEQLQKELEHLSLQISSTFDANEKLATQAFTEAAQLRVQKNELEDQLSKMQESLQKANGEIAVTRQHCDAKVQELMTQLNLSNKSQEEFLSKLQYTSNELENQIKSESKYIIRDEELSARVLVLEREAQALSNENSNLIQKAEECHIVKAELESTKISLDGCKIEKMGLEASLQRLNQEKSKLEKELSSLQEIMRNSDSELDAVKYCKSELERKVALLQSTLENQDSDMSVSFEHTNELMELYSQHNELKQTLAEQELKTEEMKNLFLSHKELQHKAEVEASQLRAHNNDLEKYSMGLQESLQTTKAQIAFIKGKYEDEVQELMTQLDLSNKQREELFSRLQSAWDDNEKWMNSKTSYIERNHELSARLGMLETELQSVLKDRATLIQKVKECDSMKAEFEKNKVTLDSTKVKCLELKSALQKVKQENGELKNELTSLKAALETSDRELDELTCSRNELEIRVGFLKSKLDDQYVEISSSTEQKAELTELHRQHSELKDRFSEQELEIEDLRTHLVHSKELLQKANVEVSQLNAKMNELEEHLSATQESLQMANVENASIRQQFEAKVQELVLSKEQREELLVKLKNATTELEIRTRNEANCLRLNEDLSLKISMLERDVETAVNENRELLQKVEESEAGRAELESAKRSLDILSTEQKVESDELCRQFSELKDRFSEQELELQDLKRHLVHSKELLQKADVEASQLNEKRNGLEKQLSVTQESLQMANTENLSMREQLENKLQELALSREQREVLSLELQNAMSELEIQTKSEANCQRINDELSFKISVMEAEKKTASNEKREFLHKVEECEALRAELESNRRSLNICNAERAELACCLNRVNEGKGKLEKELGLFKEMLRNSGSELDELKLHRDELEIMVAFLQSKVNEQNDELMHFHGEIRELKDHLSEQEAQMEELKRHSNQLKELQQKAEEEASQLRVQKKELEEHSIMIQESLRVAFIREQFEAKEQELMSELDMSKRHQDELMSQLHDMTKELEILRSSETHYMKEAEELSIRLLSLEVELQSVLKERDDLLEKVKECNAVKAEAEDSNKNLENCKAEKAQLEYLVERVNLEKEQLVNELCSLKEMLRYSDVELDDLKCCKEELEMKIVSLQGQLDSQSAQTSLHEDGNTGLMQLQKQYRDLRNKLLEKESKIEDMGKHISQLQNELQQKVDALVIVERKLKDQEDNTKATALVNTAELKSKAIALEASWQERSANGMKLHDTDKINIADAHLNEETLNSSMDRLHQELEKMKRENLAPFQQENVCELDQQEPFQKEREQLQMVNKQLENMFPSFKEPLKGGNVIDRVLALERELADALKSNDVKKRQFQSSFVKQQADQEAMLQSFRDINDLINDMLELKGRNSVLEDELKDLQNRYSQVSLKFAEVEGERQQLVMTVKNLRVAKKS